jgi:Na+-translocating ferredoxin:NAD+ oxidoreductase subunit E
VRLAANDALGMGAGFVLALLVLGSIRELLGMGSWFGLAVFGESFEPWVVMLLPGGGFFALAALVYAFRVIELRRHTEAAR